MACVSVLARLTARLDSLDAVVVAAPVDDARFDGLWLQVLGEGFAEESGKLVIGGEAEGDELFGREIVDVCALFGGEERMKTKALFETDDAVLGSEGFGTRDACHHEKDEGHDNPPEMSVFIARPIVHGQVDGDDEV